MRKAIVSYAGNYEDIALWYIFENQYEGVYVDIGCNDPIIGNVTKLFYDKGWHGINIDPIEEKIRLYESAGRNRDINLAIGISNKEGTLNYLEADVFSSFKSASFRNIQSYCEKNGLPYEMKKVSVKRLTDVLYEHLQAGQEIHILKIDVENYEKEVLEGIDFTKYKPWIICIEAVEQFTGKSYCPWEYILIEAGYSYRFEIQGNRYYCSDNHKDLPTLYGNSDEIIMKLKEEYELYKVKSVTDIDRMDRVLKPIRLLNRFFMRTKKGTEKVSNSF